MVRYGQSFTVYPIPHGISVSTFNLHPRCKNRTHHLNTFFQKIDGRISYVISAFLCVTLNDHILISMGYFADVIGTAIRVTKGVGLPHSLVSLVSP